MKFAKLLKRYAEEENGGDMVLRFKELKKQLKLIKPSDAEIGLGDAAGAPEADQHAVRTLPAEQQASLRDAEPGASGATTEAAPLSAEERAFIQTLKEDVDALNDYYVDQEETFIIRLGVLEDSMAKETDPARLPRIRKQFADLHGSMILLLHWSSLNYTAVAKILKKHDKRTGVLLRQPLLASIMKQPFTSTERITELIRKAEAHSQTLLDREGGGSCAPGAEGQQEDSEQPVESLREQHAELCRRTKAAIDVWEEMRATAVTPSTVVPAAKKRKLDAGPKPSAEASDNS